MIFLAVASASTQDGKSFSLAYPFFLMFQGDAIVDTVSRYRFVRLAEDDGDSVLLCLCVLRK